ncbi:MAG: hypothetical protein DRH11_16325 [Deltaproteobacteria bacterium]|nr:MAG: hypothetical protein DRH11_16325 [Deltaproteobacteria bacterium]
MFSGSRCLFSNDFAGSRGMIFASFYHLALPVPFLAVTVYQVMQNAPTLESGMNGIPMFPSSPAGGIRAEGT